MLDLRRLHGAESKETTIIVRVSEKEKKEIREMANTRGLTISGYLTGLHRLAKEEGRAMSYLLYDNQKEDRWAMLHRSDCPEYRKRKGDEGWSVQRYPSVEKALDGAVEHKLGTVYPCKVCSPYGV